MPRSFDKPIDKSDFYTEVFDLKGIKMILFGISVAVCSLAISTMHVIGIGGGVLGLFISIAGLYKQG